MQVKYKLLECKGRAASGSYVDGKNGSIGKSKMSTITIATDVHTLQKKLTFYNNLEITWLLVINTNVNK